MNTPELKRVRSEQELSQEEKELALRLEKVATSPQELLLRAFQSGYTHVGYGEHHDSQIIHQSLLDSLPILKEKAGLKVLCLELNMSWQNNIDQFFTTGDQNFLEPIFQEHEYLASEEGGRYLIEGRLEGKYFYDLFFLCRDLGISIKAVDDSYLSMLERDLFMTENIAKEEKCLFYVGEMHNKGNSEENPGIPYFLKRDHGIDMYSLNHIDAEIVHTLSGKREGMTRRMVETVKHSSKLQGLGMFGFDIILDEETRGLYSKISPSGAGVLYHGSGFVYHPLENSNEGGKLQSIAKLVVSTLKGYLGSKNENSREIG